MSDGILFIVLPERDVAKLQGLVRRSIVPAKHDRVRIFGDGISSTFDTDVRSRTTQDLCARISLYAQHRDDRLLIGHQTNCSIVELQGWWQANSQGGTDALKVKGAALERTVRAHLEATGIHWRTHAMTELQSYDGQPPNLQAWLQQFAELRCADIGRKIAANLRVIRTSKLPDAAFAMRATDAVGHRQAGCYLEDGDLGGSWVEMQTLLAHRWPVGTVSAVKLDPASDRLTFPEGAVDEYVIHEDGLWSGREAVRRLEAIQASPPPAPVVFRFGVVTDFGLMVARHAIRSLGLTGRVSIDASASELIGFLKADVPEPLRYGLELTTDEYFTRLHQHVDPLAFRPIDDWTPEEVQVCNVLGKQLVHGWLSHRNGEAPTSTKVELFALGGGGFASTVVFSRSVPKVCLPLLWLDGEVELGGKTQRWRPLFVDARRVIDDSLLLSA